MSDSEYKVYVRRHFVLLSFGLTMCARMMGGMRHTAIVPSYAQYHDITNQFSAPPIWGVDTFALAFSVIAIFSFIPCSYAIDRYGLRMVTVGSFLLAACNWWWYFAGKSATLVVLSVAVSALFGPLVSTSLLAISNRWYPPHERATATAFGGLLGILGSGLAFVVSPMFKTKPYEIVDLSLKSCNADAVANATRVAYQALKGNDFLPCIKEHLGAKDHFCCYLPVDIPKLNLMCAIAATAAFVFTAISVKNLPPTPPAPSGASRGQADMSSLKRMFKNQRFAKLALSDFLVSGPPIVVINTISRVVPSETAHLSVWATVAGMILAVPAAMVGGYLLDRTKAFWSFTMGGYATGTLFWAAATACIASGSRIGAYVFLGAITLAMAAYIVWQASVFEAKLEYVFEPDVPLEGVLVASDRIVLSLSSFIFIAAIPPERVGGAANTFYIGLAVMIIGCIPTAIIRDKFRYRRMAYDAEAEEKKTDEENSSQPQTCVQEVTELRRLPSFS